MEAHEARINELNEEIESALSDGRDSEAEDLNAELEHLCMELDSM